GRLWLNLNAFYTDRDDAQLSQSHQQIPGDPNSFVFLTGNGQAHVYGLEASGAWQLHPSWRIEASLGLLESNIDRWAARPEVEGRRLAHAPPYTASLALNYSSGSGWFARADLSLVGPYYFDISHDQRSSAYQLVGLRMGHEWTHWSASVWARNVFDENHATRGFYFGNEPPAFANKLYTKFGDPRQLGVAVDYRW
ncbi:MAG TPA: TonB-dependent receptor, partial [Chromatiales bacterium]|nr:TonB-dependent receptor [Chromatiales bacterium]